MNLLAVDIGNTDIKFGVFQDGQLTRHWRASGTRTSPEKFSALLRDSLSRTGVTFDRVVYSSVVPIIELAFRKTIQYCFHLSPSQVFAIDPLKIRLPLDMSCYPPNQLGMDRLVNACSARLLYPDTSLVVVDFGTATTFDLVTADGVYLGGAIAPGLYTMAEGLPERTSRLPHISLEGLAPEDLGMGTDTVSCMRAGIGIGYRGLMKELLREAVQALDTTEFLLVATGGLAETSLRLCGLEKHFMALDPMLTLKGLELLYQYNHAPAKV
jgi:type III pantothenate kinase